MVKSYEEQINNAMYNTLQEMTPLLSLHDLRELQKVMVKNFAEATNSDKHQPTNEEYIAKYFAAKKIEGIFANDLFLNDGGCSLDELGVVHQMNTNNI